MRFCLSRTTDSPPTSGRLFALPWSLQGVGSAALDALLSASHYVERARLNPDSPYHPEPEAERVLVWRDLSRGQRLRAAEAAGVPPESLDADGYPSSLEDYRKIAWTHEALTGARIQLPMDLSELRDDTRV
jgi:hypothetical protein